MTRNKSRALWLFALTIALALSPLIAPSVRGYDPRDFAYSIADPLIQPAGYTFSIWLPLFAALIWHGWTGFATRAVAADWDRIRPPMIVAVLIAALWLNVAALLPLLATAMILGMAGSAVAALLRIGVTAERALRWPVAAFAGWSTAAAGVAVGVVAGGMGLISQFLAALTILLVLLIVGAAVALKARSPLYAGVLVWALLGIFVGNLGDAPAVRYGALLGALIMTLVAAKAWRDARA
ncbi:hypothetical protein V8J36_11780 [Frigidibacter sp. MR17.14]|uniref:hypothetical protein n=1 Tax=Frigidibacter sp. MR17.14 TaxID=3126509 RepID=UPI003012D65E